MPVKFVWGNKVWYKKQKQQEILLLLFSANKKVERNRCYEFEHIVVTQITDVAQKNTGDADDSRQARKHYLSWIPADNPPEKEKN